MNSQSRRDNPARARAGAATADEELETGEPIPEEAPRAPAETPMPAKAGKFVAKPWEQTGGGQLELASAKYLKKKPEKSADPKGRKAQAQPSAESGRSLEGSVFNSGMAGGLLAMVGAVVWFVAGLMNDVIFFYPPILFVIGLGAFFKGMAGGSQE